jgi:formate dehydrogenase subunit delta
MSEIHTTPSERLVMMANQIAKAFAAQGEARAVQKTAEHIQAFWNPRMRRKIDEHLETGGEGLEPYALAALIRLKTGQTNAVPPVGDSVPSAPEHRSDHDGGGGWRFKLLGFSRAER